MKIALVAAALEQIADLPNGQTDQDGPEHPSRTVIYNETGIALYVRHHPDGNWVLSLEPQREHCRWCDNLEQLLSDLQYFFVTDQLPREKYRWF